MTKLKVTINNKEILVPAGITVMQACEIAGEEIPRFCYHERLSIAGNCRMCLVEIEKSPKPVASCAMPVLDQMVISTESEKVKKARKGVMEFLLINHPLDCPICDQGGECDLQDQSIYYGKSTSRFEESKRAVSEKNFGPLIKTVMTRCIHCTRCVRFMDEVAGSHDLGAINRGEEVEITSSIKEGLKSEMSGNIIDLCPVGALTSKPYAFKARSWELKHHDSIDILDAVCSNIRIDEFGGEIKRILPRINESINQEWISDKSRFSYDGLSNQRLDKPYHKKNSKLYESIWPKAIKIFEKKLKEYNKKDIIVTSGPHVDLETLFVAKKVLSELKITNIDCRFNSSEARFSNRSEWLFNEGISGIDKIDKLFIIGADPKREAPTLNSRIRQRWISGNLEIMGLCVPEELNYDFKDYGNDIAKLNDETFLKDYYSFFNNAEYPMIILGDQVLCSKQGDKIHNLVKILSQKAGIIKEKWNGYSYLSSNASRVGALEVGFYPNDKKNIVNKYLLDERELKNKLLILIENDDIDINSFKGDNNFIIYIGHHGDKVANKADLILPCTAYTEKAAMFLNIEGRPQFTSKVTNNYGKAVDSWKIFRALGDKFNINFNFNNHKELMIEIYKKYPHLSKINDTVKAKWANVAEDNIKIKKEYFDTTVTNFYQTCSISRASSNMAACVKEFLQKK